MTGFPYPYMIVVSDGRTMRALHPRSLGRHQGTIEAALSDLVLAEPDKPAPVVERAPSPSPAPVAPVLMQVEIARAQGYTGDPCSTCGQFRLKPSGHCMVCEGCGTTTGCS